MWVQRQVGTVGTACLYKVYGLLDHVGSTGGKVFSQSSSEFRSISSNFSPLNRSMRYVTPFGPGDLSGGSLCISSITSCLWIGDSNSGSIGWVGLAISCVILVVGDWIERASFSLNGDSLWQNIWWPKAYRNLCNTRGSNVKGPWVHICASLDGLSFVCYGSVDLVRSVLYALGRSHVESLSAGICCTCPVTSVVTNC